MLDVNDSTTDYCGIVTPALVAVEGDLTIRSVNDYFIEVFGDLIGSSVLNLASSKKDEENLKILLGVTNCKESQKSLVMHLTTSRGPEAFSIFGTSIRTYNDSYQALVICRALDIDTVDQLKLHANRMEITKLINSQLSHELRSPLTSFSLNLSYLKSKVDYYQSQCLHQDENNLCKELFQYSLQIDGMKSQVEYMEDILNNLSEFAKLSSLKLEKINLKKVVLGTAKLLRTASRLKELNQDQFIVKVDQLEDAEIDGNSVSVSQVLWNLCTNAFEAIDNKGKIFILGDKDDRFVYLRVCNTGHIPDEIIDKMFDPYFSSKSGHHRGLGLFIVRNLVLRLNGCIWVNNFISQELGCSLAIVNLKFPQYGNDDIVSISISDDLNETRLKALLD